MCLKVYLLRRVAGSVFESLPVKEGGRMCSFDLGKAA